ncbi:uncharacterized protein G2W53_034060 [Senna tora]|uniref:Uncharacterized protein n=1 Tax=Senna tora TaxID=362788 RepID=A0A834SZM8_9FABA|nr:uncharacterized protein G2W53_034060 [Senna tora]
MVIGHETSFMTKKKEYAENFMGHGSDLEEVLPKPNIYSITSLFGNNHSFASLTVRHTFGETAEKLVASPAGRRGRSPGVSRASLGR